jgi:hypothetical protein
MTISVAKTPKIASDTRSGIRRMGLNESWRWLSRNSLRDWDERGDQVMRAYRLEAQHS